MGRALLRAVRRRLTSDWGASLDADHEVSAHVRALVRCAAAGSRMGARNPRRVALAVLAAGILAVALAAATLPGTAHASDPWDSWTPAERRGAAEFVQRNAGMEATCTGACIALERAQEEDADGLWSSSGGDLVHELVATQTRAGFLRQPVQANLPLTLTLGVGAFTVGVVIGDQLNRRIFRIGFPSVSGEGGGPGRPWQWDDDYVVTRYAPGDTIYGQWYNYHANEWSWLLGNTSVGTYQQYQALPGTTPPGREGSCADVLAPRLQFAGFTERSTGVGSGSYCGNVDSFIYTRPIEVETITRMESDPSPPDQQYWVPAAPMPETPEEAEGIVGGALLSDEPLAAWMDSTFEDVSPPRIQAQLRAQNPEVSVAEIDAVASECEKLTTVLSGGDENCLDLPIFATGSDVPEPTRHDWDAITGPGGHPEWVLLNYESSVNKNDAWKNNEAECTPRQPGLDCDEYPFLASMQGGAPEPGMVRPSLRQLNADQNRLQGTRYSQFLRNCQVDQLGEPFLVIPLRPELNFPTVTNLCNFR